MADHTTECPYCAATFEPDELTRLREQLGEAMELLSRARDHMTGDGYAFDVKQEIDALLAKWKGE